ncbi:MAG: ferritin-like domain-containing protein [Alphaproteobacteria bacterium]|nr:ferritin-like domain-containing protein [Alphaproteobacteria bacterium]
MSWSLDDIAWSRFEAARVDREILQVVKAAALVERNAADYVDYLCRVFPDDAEFKAAARQWGVEEERHGEALARWARLADPDFDFAAALGRFVAGYRLPLGATRSVRGSQAGELIARCIVECGTSSFYSAIRDASHEPVLRDICHRIAGDEFRHYRLFQKHLNRYGGPRSLSLARRLAVAFGRVSEAGDDELAMAFHCANRLPEPFDRVGAAARYELLAGKLYRPAHSDRMVAMIAKAIDLNPQGRLVRLLQRLAWRLVRARHGWLAWRQAAA